jgi:hypothetical protein
MEFGPIPALVFPMCREGSIVQYVENHPFVNKLQLVCHFNQKYISPVYSEVGEVGSGSCWR